MSSNKQCHGNICDAWHPTNTQEKRKLGSSNGWNLPGSAVLGSRTRVHKHSNDTTPSSPKRPKALFVPTLGGISLGRGSQGTSSLPQGSEEFLGTFPVVHYHVIKSCDKFITRFSKTM